ncbi:protein kinase domain-containing protein [Halococcoides cellulosivorans]|uniref:Protein kinase domain-containing protein n=1 Tax=Halococcoides cellulosivorans TaxID=1679096 RepID=A0A2R4WY36_9EURY|nr:serine/threonine-protein kinase [Halococcoides cellulosivorans]AWB26453.1 hypothetical protein HARCEL1_01335 [Halococcoides cellulosivorans]
MVGYRRSWALGRGRGAIDPGVVRWLTARRADRGRSEGSTTESRGESAAGLETEADRSRSVAGESDPGGGERADSDADRPISDDQDHRALIDRLRRAEARVEAAESARADNDYPAAVAAFDGAREDFRAARDRAAELPNTKHLVVRETRGDAIVGRLESVEAALREVRAKRAPYDRLDGVLTDVADQRAAARGELDGGAFGAARTIATDACETLALVERAAAGHDLDVGGRIASLREALDRTLDRADRRAERPGALAVRPPAVVPRAPRLSLSPTAYEPQAVVGTSGTSVVERALAAVTDRERQIALKRFRVEADIDAAVDTWISVADHDHVAGVVDHGTDPEPWIAVEYLDGGRIDERAGRLPTDQALWTAAAIADAVWHAHRQDVIHGRITPSNVLFRSVEDAWDVPRVTDWAVGRAQRDTDDLALATHPRNGAPEQLAGETADERTDVFQLGTVLYELVTGERPFGADHRDRSPADFERPTPPSELVAVPAAIDDVLGRALAPDPDDRYQRALFFRDDLRDLYRSY